MRSNCRQFSANGSATFRQKYPWLYHCRKINVNHLMRKYSKHRNYTKTYFFAQDRQKTLFFGNNEGCLKSLPKRFT